MICICGCQAELPKTQYFRTKTQKLLIICQINWREVGVAFKLQCLRNCTLSSNDYFTNVISDGLTDRCRHTTFTVDGRLVQLLTLEIVLFTHEQMDEINNRSVTAAVVLGRLILRSFVDVL